MHLLKELSRFSKGVNNPFFGKKHTEDTKELLRKATTLSRKNISYEEFYGNRAEEEKQKRAVKQKQVWNSRSKKEKDNIKEKIKLAKINIDVSGGNNPNSKEVYIDNVKFNSISEAKKHYNKSRYKLFKEHKITY